MQLHKFSPSPLGLCIVMYCWASQPRDLMHVGKRPMPIHHLGSWWEACLRELEEDCCQRVEIFWPINKTHVKKYKLGVKMLTACRNVGEES